LLSNVVISAPLIARVTSPYEMQLSKVFVSLWDQSTSQLWCRSALSRFLEGAPYKFLNESMHKL